MSQHEYMFSAEKEAEELDRLKLQASIYDPVTIRHLETIGVAEGWKCLEVGAGVRSIAEWLSTRVGPAGRVVATDIDLRFLGRLSASNLEIRRHDILKDDLEKRLYDVVHCRLVLMHLPEPEKALKRMADAIRPGGWLLIEEFDYGSSLSLDVTDTSATASIFVAFVRAQNDFVRKKGLADPYFGRRVRGLVEGLGYADVAQEGWTRMGRGSDPSTRVSAAITMTVIKARVAAGEITQEEGMKVHRMLLDPAFYCPSHTLFSAWGRKPVSQE